MGVANVRDEWVARWRWRRGVNAFAVAALGFEALAGGGVAFAGDGDLAGNGAEAITGIMESAILAVDSWASGIAWGVGSHAIQCLS